MPRRHVVTPVQRSGLNDCDTRPGGSSPFDLFVRGNETGDWLAILDEFRNWMLKTA